jgi:hypothetical protein
LSAVSAAGTTFMYVASCRTGLARRHSTSCLADRQSCQPRLLSQNKGSRMAKPNYAFEKRQKEIAKKKKKEEKLQQKAAQQNERAAREPQQPAQDEPGNA